MIKNSKLNSINLNNFYYFWIIAKEGSIRAASLKLHLSQSTLSEHLKSFESQIGTSLFDRESSRLKINENGQRLLDFGNEYFPKAELLFVNLKSKNRSVDRMIRVGILPSLAKDWLHSSLSPFFQSKHDLIRISEDEYNYLILDFAKKNLDLIFSNVLPAGLQTKYEYIELEKLNLVPVCSSLTYKNLKSQEFSEVVRTLSFINYTEKSILHSKILQYFLENNLVPNVTHEMDDLVMMKSVLESGECFALIPLDSVVNDVERGDLVYLSDVIHEIDISIYALFHKCDLGNYIRSRLIDRARL